MYNVVEHRIHLFSRPAEEKPDVERSIASKSVICMMMVIHDDSPEL